MTIVCNIWMICLELNWFVYDPSRMLHLSEFVWTQRSSVWVVFNNFLLIDATDRSKISSDQKRLFIALSLYPLSFFANTPFIRKTNLDLMSIYRLQFNIYLVSNHGNSLVCGKGKTNQNPGNFALNQLERSRDQTDSAQLRSKDLNYQYLVYKNLLKL